LLHAFQTTCTVQGAATNVAVGDKNDISCGGWYSVEIEYYDYFRMWCRVENLDDEDKIFILEY
jgi:hypothetical protein